MIEHPNTARGDVAYWRLSHAQAAGYHARLSGMHADASRRFADLATGYVRSSARAGRVVLVLTGVAIALAVLALVIR